MEEEQTVRIFCKNSTLNAAARGDQVILVPADSSDKSQDYSAIGNLTDDEGRRAFVLVNRTTGQAMVNTPGSGKVKLAAYSGHVSVELSKLWSLGQEDRDGFCSVRVLQKIHYTLNGLDGNAREGTVVGTYASEQTNNALWKIAPINEQ